MDRARLISDDYTVLNAKLHALGKYGVHGDKWANPPFLVECML